MLSQTAFIFCNVKGLQQKIIKFFDGTAVLYCLYLKGLYCTVIVFEGTVLYCLYLKGLYCTVCIWRDCTRNFKWSSMPRWQNCPIYQGTLQSVVLLSIIDIYSFFYYQWHGYPAKTWINTKVDQTRSWMTTFYVPSSLE